MSPEPAGVDDSADEVLEEAMRNARRLTHTGAGLACANGCGNTTAAADQQLCAHDDPVCDDCWPNGCGWCQRKLARDVARVDEATTAVLTAAHQLVEAQGRLAMADARLLDVRVRSSLTKAAEQTIDACGLVLAQIIRSNDRG